MARVDQDPAVGGAVCRSAGKAAGAWERKRASGLLERPRARAGSPRGDSGRTSHIGLAGESARPGTHTACLETGRGNTVRVPTRRADTAPVPTGHAGEGTDGPVRDQAGRAYFAASRYERGARAPDSSTQHDAGVSHSG